MFWAAWNITDKVKSLLVVFLNILLLEEWPTSSGKKVEEWQRRAGEVGSKTREDGIIVHVSYFYMLSKHLSMS